MLVQTNGGKYRFNPNLYAVSVHRNTTSLPYLTPDAGWESVLVLARYMVRTRLDCWEVNVVAGMCGANVLGTVMPIPILIPPQVLISIQSMILCEEPYLNEPGWANSGGTPKSLACEYLIAPKTALLLRFLQTRQTSGAWWSRQQYVRPRLPAAGS